MAGNEVNIRVTGTNTSGPAIKQPGEDVDELSKKAKVASVDMKSLSDGFAAASEKGSELSKALERDVTFADYLKDRTTKLRTEIRTLGDEFNRTGNADIFAKLQKSQEELGGFEQLSKSLTKALDDGSEKAKSKIKKDLQDSGNTAEDVFGNGIVKGFSKLPIEAQASFVGLAAAASLPLATAVEGAILAGISSAGIGTAIAAHMHDPDVTSAFGQLWRDVSGGLQNATPLWTAELVNVADKGREAWGRILPGYADAVNSLLGPTDHLVDGITGLAEKAAPGFEKAMTAGGKVIDQISKDLPGVGVVLDRAFSLLARDSDVAAKGMHDIVLAADDLITATAVIGDQFAHIDALLEKITGGNLEKVILGFGAGAGNLDKLGNSTQSTSDKLAFLITGFGSFALKGKEADKTSGDLSKTLDDLTARLYAQGGAVDYAAGTAASASQQYQALASGLAQVNYTADNVAAAMTDKLINATMQLDQTTLGVAESETRLADAFTKNGLAIDNHTHFMAMNTAAGQANREAVLAVVQANEQQYNANIASGMSASDAAAAYDANTQALEHQLRQAGLTTAQIDDLIGKYKGVPDKVNTEIATEGLTDAINDLSTLIRQINGIKNQRFTFTVDGTVTYHVPDPSQFFHGGAFGGPAAGGYSGAVGHRQEGGPGTSLMQVNEMGRELIRLPIGSMVIPHGQSEQIISDATRNSGNPSGVISIEFVGDVDSAFASALSKMNREGMLNFKWKAGV